MGTKVFVGEDDTVAAALRRLRKLLIDSRRSDKWPWRNEYHANPSTIRNRKRWISGLPRKRSAQTKRRMHRGP